MNGEAGEGREASQQNRKVSPEPPSEVGIPHSFSPNEETVLFFFLFFYKTIIIVLFLS